MDYKIAFKVALKWLPHEGVYKEVVDKASYQKAIKNENYDPEYIQDLMVLRRAYLDLNKGDNHAKN